MMLQNDIAALTTRWQAEQMALFFWIRRDLFYLLDYVTRRSENWDLKKKKKIGLDTIWWEISKYGCTFIPLEKKYAVSLSNS